MKLLTLNIWGGKIHEELLSFLSRNHQIDIFCFQEVFHGVSDSQSTNDFINHPDARRRIYGDIEKVLPGFAGYFCPVLSDKYGIAIFVKKGIEVLSTGKAVMFENNEFDPNEVKMRDHTRKLQWLKVRSLGKEYVIVNVHGHWHRDGKEDNPARIHQSEVILKTLEQHKGLPIVVVGDFNLRPDTESVRMLEQKMTNLIRTHNVKKTRTGLYTGKEPHADYVFLSLEVTEKDFAVLPDEVSDHAALFVEFE